MHEFNCACVCVCVCVCGELLTVDQEYFAGKIFCRLNFCVVFFLSLWLLNEINLLYLFVKENICWFNFRHWRWLPKFFHDENFPIYSRTEMGLKAQVCVLAFFCPIWLWASTFSTGVYTCTVHSIKNHCCRRSFCSSSLNKCLMCPCLCLFFFTILFSFCLFSRGSLCLRDKGHWQLHATLPGRLVSWTFRSVAGWLHQASHCWAHVTSKGTAHSSSSVELAFVCVSKGLSTLHSQCAFNAH